MAIRLSSELARLRAHVGLVKVRLYVGSGVGGAELARLSAELAPTSLVGGATC